MQFNRSSVDSFQVDLNLVQAIRTMLAILSMIFASLPSKHWKSKDLVMYSNALQSVIPECV